MDMSKPAYICPKCGYDQSGMIDSWTDRCPVRGRCAECGLEFAWADVFYPIRNTVWWYAEHSRSIWEMVRRTPGSIGRLVLPWKFWGQVDIRKSVMVWRLWFWVFLVAMVAHVLVSIPYGFGFWTRNYAYRWGGYTFADHWADTRWNGLGELVVGGLFYPAIESQLWSGRGGSRLVLQAGESRYIYTLVLKPIAFQIGIIALWCVVLMAIPSTRQLAKIRKAHVLRAFGLSALLAILTLELSRLVDGLVMWSEWYSDSIRFLKKCIVLVGIFLQVVFWTSCIVIGWRVRPWKTLVFLGMLAALLGGVAFQVYLFLWSAM